jgi:predicted permease
LTVLTGILFGLAPVLRIGGEADLQGLRDSTRTGGGQKERLRSVLVVAEIVASVVLLVSAGLLMRALWTVQAIDPGLRADGVVMMRTALPVPQYGKVATRETFYSEALSQVRALPGVISAAYTSFQPMGKMRGGIWPVSVDGKPADRVDNQTAFLRYVTPGYFATLGIPLKAGRDVADADTTDRRPYVAVVSESFVKRYWPGETPSSVLGRPFNFALDDRVVIGVSGDVRMRGLERQSEPQVYLSSRQVADGSIIGYIPRSLIVRTSSAPASFVPSIRGIIRRLDPTLPVADVGTMAEAVDNDTASRGAQLRVIGAFAIIAFVLAGVGIHGLLSFAVSQRAQEIGVRRALGAQSGAILAMVVGRCVRLAGVGVVLGVALAYVAGRQMEALLAGVKPADTITLLAAVGLSIVMTVIGSVMPTLRALRVDPLTAIRTE